MGPNQGQPGQGSTPPMEPTAKRVDILEEITADPEFINRGASDATESLPPAVPVSGSGVAVSVADPAFDRLLAAVQPIRMERDGEHRVPQVNLMPTPEELAAFRKQLAAAAAPVAAAQAPVPAAGGPVLHKRRTGLVVAGVLGLVLAGAGAAYVMLVMKPGSEQLAEATPTPVASPTPTPTPTPSPSPTPAPTPSPTPTPAPQTVTAPTTAPTAKNPQVVTITSQSGLWLRSSPTSVDRSNIIGWMPNGAQISVDQVGDFWWHGTYKGRSGYFASKYTQ